MFYEKKLSLDNMISFPIIFSNLHLFIFCFLLASNKGRPYNQNV